MEEQVVIEVTSAIVVDGVIVLPGQSARVLASDARVLLAQGKAVRVESAEPAGNAEVPAEPEEPATEPVARAPKARAGKSR